MKTKQIIITFIFLLAGIIGYSQTAEELYEQSLEELGKKNYERGIKLMDNLIEKYPDFKEIHKIYLNRATAKSLIKDYDGALKDFTTAYEKNPEYAEAVRQRGYLRKQMGDFKAALTDYDLALKINPKLAAAYVNKAAVLDTMGQMDEACKYYEKALEMGITTVAGRLYHKCDSNSLVLQKYYYKILVDKTTDKSYGYSKDNPIKVGHGPHGQKAFLGMLRDGKGNKIEFERGGSVGFYPSKNGMFGLAAIDSYHIVYKNEKGKKKKTTLYLSFYDYDPPKIPVGFYSTQDFPNGQ